MPGTTSRGYTMLMIRVEEGDFEGVKTALQKYTNEKINDQNKHGQTALALAARNGNCNIGEHLILEGADVNLPNKSGQTPLFIACSYNHIEFVKLLLRHKAEVNMADSRGWTPLMSACQNSNVPLVELLLKNRADVRPIDRFGKTARQRTKEPKITSLLLEIEKRIDQFEESNFVTPRKKSVRALSEESPNKTGLKSSLAHLDDEDEDQDILDMYSSNLDQTLRACPQFVSDMEIYKMHKKAGYYNYLKSVDPRNLRAGSLQNLKSDRRDRSLEFLLDLNSTLKSPMTMTELTDRSRGRRDSLKDAKGPSSIGKLNDPGSSSFKTAKKGRHGAKEGETSSPKSSRTRSTPLLGDTVVDQKMDSSLLKSAVSPAGTNKPKYKSILKNSTRLEEASSAQTLNMTQHDQHEDNDDEVLNDELRNLYRTFIEKLADRTQKIMNDKVAKAIDQETEQNGPISKEKMDDIINNIGGKLEDQTITSFKALVAELMDTFPLTGKLGKAVEEGTEALVNRVTLYAQEDISRLNHSLNSNGKGDQNTSIDKLKNTITGKIDELFKALDATFSDNSDSDKEAAMTKFSPEVLEALDKLKQRIINGLENDEEEGNEVAEDLKNNNSPSALGLKKLLQIPSQPRNTSEVSGNMRYSGVQDSSDMEEMPHAAVPKMAKKDNKSSKSGSPKSAVDNSIEMEIQNNNKPHEKESLDGLEDGNLSTRRTTDPTNNTEACLRSLRAHSLESDNDVSMEAQVTKGTDLNAHKAQKLESDANTVSEASSPQESNKNTTQIQAIAIANTKNSQDLESDVESNVTSPSKVEGNNAGVSVNTHNPKDLESDKEGSSQASSPSKNVPVDKSITITLATSVNLSSNKKSLTVESVKFNAKDIESDKSGASKKTSSPQEANKTGNLEVVTAISHHAHELESDANSNSNVASPNIATKENVNAEDNMKNQNTKVSVDTNNHRACELESDADTNSNANISSPSKTEQNTAVKICTQTQNAQDLESDKDSGCEIQSPREESQSQSQSDDLVVFGKSQKSQKTREFNNDQENSRKFTETEERDDEHGLTGDDMSGRKIIFQRVETKESEVIYDDQSQRVFEQSGVILGRKKEILRDDSLADIEMVESELVSNFDGLTDKGTPMVRDGAVTGRRVFDKLNTLESEVLYRFEEENTQIRREGNDEIKEEDFNDEEILKSKMNECGAEDARVQGQNTDSEEVRSNAQIDAETNRKTLLRRHIVSEKITSFTSRARPMIPKPTPSRFVTKTVRVQIDEVPLCENFHYLGQSKKLRGRSLAVARKVWRETTVGMEQIVITDH